MRLQIRQLEPFLSDFVPPDVRKSVVYETRRYHFPTGNSDQQHYLARRVKLHVRVDALPLDAQQRVVFRELVGKQRIGPLGQTIKIRADELPYRFQNKQYVSNLLTALVVSARTFKPSGDEPVAPRPARRRNVPPVDRDFQELLDAVEHE
jgi:hypothetical protein